MVVELAATGMFRLSCSTMKVCEIRAGGILDCLRFRYHDSDGPWVELTPLLLATDMVPFTVPLTLSYRRMTHVAFAVS
jgi:hypothetical protein